MSLPVNNPNQQGQQWGPVPPMQPQYVARPEAPSIATTVLVTLFFGIFGLIPAASAAGRAKQYGYPSGKYWGAFFGIFGAYFLLMVVILGGAA